MVYFSSQLEAPLIREVKDRNSIREGTGSQSWYRDCGRVLLTGLYLMAGSFCFLIVPRTTIPEIALLTRSWINLCWTVFKKVQHRLAHRSFWWRHFHNWFFFPQMIVPCIVDKTSQNKGIIHLGRKRMSARTWRSWSHPVGLESGSREVNTDA